MRLFGESEKKKSSRLAKWASNVEKAVARKTRRLDLFLEGQLVVPESDSDVRELFQAALGGASEYGMMFSGSIEGCDFVAMLPFGSKIMIFLFDVSIDFTASCVNTSGTYAMSGSGTWVCEPKNRRRARQLNRRLPTPVVQRFRGDSIYSIDRCGHLVSTGEGGTELSLYGWLDNGAAIPLFAAAMGSLGDIIRLLSEGT